MHNVSINNFDEYISCELMNDLSFYKEKKIEWDSEVGKGSINEIFIRPGLSLIIENFDFLEPVSALMEVTHAPVEIFYCVSGCLEGQLEKVNKNLKMDSGNASFFFTPDLKGKTLISAEEPLKLVTIRFDPEILNPCFCGLTDFFPFTGNVFTEQEDGCIVANSPMTAEMKMAVTQILKCSYKDAFKKVYFETKAMELITLYFAEMESRSTKFLSSGSFFYSSEIEKIHEAREILLEDIENPPGLGELARKVGMNKDKLNQGFYKVFGTSAFSFFRNNKMEKARKILETGEMNVTEAAYCVGYSQPGSFSRAFKQYYGMNPKDYLRKANLEN